ncbi:MAG: hypothetical protein NC048_04195 [Bacteroides sp.]|nr:hypothetical protein [Ruminococcus flavefaciens]MCM1554676.1 hypothetical protein [Bacteroides sp.]
MAVLNNHDSAKMVLDSLLDLRRDYGLWSRSVSCLSQYGYFKSSVEIENMILSITNEMISKCKGMGCDDSDIAAILSGRKKPIDCALSIMILFETKMAKNIQCKKDVVEKNLISFFSQEQNRIDAIVS